MANRHSNQSGFSLIEVIVVVAVMTALMSMAVGVTTDMVKAAKADNATGALLNVLEVARNQATSERRDFQVVFTAPNKVEIFRLEIPSGSTLRETRYLEAGQIYARFGLPDTPDTFGHAGAIAFGSTPTIRFTSDGSLIDSSGDVLNGTVYVGLENQVSSARAVTIFGATGLIRTWKWGGSAWLTQ